MLEKIKTFLQYFSDKKMKIFVFGIHGIAYLAGPIWFIGLVILEFMLLVLAIIAIFAMEIWLKKRRQK